MDLIIVYITTRDPEQAHYIGRKLVEQQLVACVNIIGGMQSIYRWDGQICEDSEAVLIAKARKSCFESIVTRVKELHTYTCPCIIAFPITGGSPDYLQWLEKQTERN